MSEWTRPTEAEIEESIRRAVDRPLIAQMAATIMGATAWWFQGTHDGYLTEYQRPAADAVMLARAILEEIDR